ncbi:YdeI/OmpD-associated family protein [Streptomyces sp. NBC_01390]|uniref:YdeI/OmpD-associated family protein n=1 Tax=Streptomyces sp. NBC_01390 TaxID=2903850 RepID=UPI003862EADD
MSEPERDPRARAAFEVLGRTDRYQVVLPLLKAGTPDSRAARLAAAVAGLMGGATGSGDSRGSGDTTARQVGDSLS